MAIEHHAVCTNCKKFVPDECDGKLFTVSEWGPNSRAVCKGSDGDKFVAEGKYRIVRGMGIEYDVPMNERKS